MSEQHSEPRRECAALAAVAAVLIVLAAAGTYLTLPVVVLAEATDSAHLVERDQWPLPVYESTADVLIMPGREY